MMDAAEAAAAIEAAAIEVGAALRRSLDFVAGADKLEAVPDATLPEIAFAGRSNVGKSA